nr:heavy-metal-associated domain-containing protein [Roseomonas haemaphysalidis]
MSCEHCVKAVTQAIRSRDPAAEVVIDLASGRLRATTTLPRDQVQAAVEEEGYGVAG